VLLDRRAENKPADPAEAVNADFNSHTSLQRFKKFKILMR
jgi:hypothetical protein